MNMERNRREPPCVGRIRLRTRILYVPSAPCFLARKTSAIPPAPRRRTISNWAISFGGGEGDVRVIERADFPESLHRQRPYRAAGRPWANLDVTQSYDE